VEYATVVNHGFHTSDQIIYKTVDYNIQTGLL